MVNASSIEYIENEARVSRVYDCISRILSIPLDKAKENYPSKSDEFKHFQEVCSFMAQKQSDGRKYPRWLTQLLIEVPYENLLIHDLDQWKISKAANFNAGIPDDALPELIDTQQTMRKILANKLYNCLPEREKKDFGNLLGYGRLNLAGESHTDEKQVKDSSYSLLHFLGYDKLYPIAKAHILEDRWYQHDVRCAELLYALEYWFSTTCVHYEEFHGKFGISKAEIAKQAFSILYEYIQFIVKKTPDSNDSLFAKLLFNIALNRAILEIDYQHYLDNIAQENSIRLIRFLQKRKEQLPTIKFEEEILPYLERIFNIDHPDIKRKIKTKMIRNAIMNRSKVALLIYIMDNLDDRLYLLQEDKPIQNQFLMALSVAWNYVTQTKIVTQQEGIKHKTIEIISGRQKWDSILSQQPQEENSIRLLLPEIRLYHNSQHELLLYSEQLDNLSVSKLEKHARDQASYQIYKRMFFTNILKKRTLSKIHKLHKVFSVNIKENIGKYLFNLDTRLSLLI